MNRVRFRSMLTLILPAVLLVGLIFFLGEYLLQGGSWAGHYASPYTSSGIGNGYVVDRSGEILLDTTGERNHYSEDLTTRMSTMHLLGDRYGSITAPAVAEYADQMSGFNVIQGLYTMHPDVGQAVLTIDAEIQNTALRALDGRKGTVAVYNYNTGEILCAVTSPTYDPDDVPDIEGDTTGRYEGTYLNRFTQVSYTPGSIFKVATTAAALSELPNAEDITFVCEGSCIIGGDEVKCEGYHGEINLKQALMYSCNCYFGQLAVKLGADTLQKYVEKFQLTESVSFDGITTRAGHFDLSDAAPVNVAWGGIGQFTDLVNPCRYLLFMGQIAGGGVAAEPFLVRSVRNGDGAGYSSRLRISDRVLSTETALQLHEMMRYNVQVNYGDYNFPDIQVCAKTGTAEQGGDANATATFAGYSLDPDYPLAFVVIVENGGSGKFTCVPIMSKVLSACVRIMDKEH